MLPNIFLKTFKEKQSMKWKANHIKVEDKLHHSNRVVTESEEKDIPRLELSVIFMFMYGSSQLPCERGQAQTQ